MTDRRTLHPPVDPAAGPPPRDRVAEAVRRAAAVVAVPHRPLDGDGLGSALGLCHALRTGGKQAAVAIPAGLPDKLGFLPGAAEVVTDLARLPFEPDLVVALDANQRSRFGTMLPEGVEVAVVDHHVGHGDFGDIRWLEPSYAATGAMVFELVGTLGLPLDAAAAQCLYTALVSDTGRFSYPNTTSAVHRAAASLLDSGARPEPVLRNLIRGLSHGQLLLRADVALALGTSADGRVAWSHVSLDMCRRRGVEPTQARDLVEITAGLRDVELSALFRERTDGIHVSLRSSGNVDCAALAARHGGGGHARAAGFRSELPLKDAIARLQPELLRWVDRS